MSIEVKIPHIGESISEVQIAEWLKRDGDEVQKDENIAVIDSEKTTLELPAPENGRLKILHKSGATVKVGEIVANIEAGNVKAGNAEPAKGGDKAASKAPAAGSAPAAKEAKLEAAAKKKVEEVPPVEKQSSQVKEPTRSTTIGVEKPVEAAPANRMAEAAKQTPETKASAATESRANGTETQAAPKPALEAKVAKVSPPTAGERQVSFEPGKSEKIVPMTMLRRTVAKRLLEARQEMAMLTTFNEVDTSAVQALRKEHQEIFEKRYQIKLGFMSFFVKAVVAALKQYPQLNAEIRENDIVYHQRFDIGVAIASDRGLVVPILRQADRMSFAEIEKSIANYAKVAREGALKPSDLTGGTFTITNGGVFGSLLSTPIINPPQTGILGMHSIQERPIAHNGQVVIRPMMYIALTYDHRLVDGKEAVLFLRSIKEGIESPARMLIEI